MKSAGAEESGGLKKTTFSLSLFKISLCLTVGWLGLFLILPAFQAHATIDDFCFGAVARAYGVFGGTWHWYQTTTGRVLPSFFTTAAAAISFLYFESTWMGWYVVGVICVSWAVLGFVCIRYFKMSKQWAFLCGALLIFVAYRATPIISKSWYWPCAVAIYVLPPALVCLFSFETCRTYLGQERVLRPLALFSLGLFGSLWNEIVAPLAVVVALAALIGVWSERRRGQPPAARLRLERALWAGFLGASLGTLAMILSPGNWERSALYIAGGAVPIFDPSDIFRATIRDMLQLHSEIFRWRGVLGGLACLATGATLVRAGVASIKALPPARWILAFGLASSLVLCMVPIIATGVPPPWRVMVTTALLYAVTAFALGMHLGALPVKWLRVLQVAGLTGLLVLDFHKVERKFRVVRETIAYSQAFTEWHSRVLAGEPGLSTELPPSGYLFRHEAEPGDGGWVQACVRDSLGLNVAGH